MRPYEVMVILDAELDEAKIGTVIDRAVDVLKANGGTPGQISRWGKRRFAYEINHRWEGYYVLVEATAEPSAMNEVHRTLTLADEVIRHKVIRLPDGKPGRSASAAPQASASAPTRTGA